MSSSTASLVPQYLFQEFAATLALGIVEKGLGIGDLDDRSAIHEHHGVGDLVAKVKEVTDAESDALVAEYKDQYEVIRSEATAIREAARIELGMRAFLEEGGFNAFTTTFEDLHGLVQLPGLAVQRLMADGYGLPTKAL